MDKDVIFRALLAAVLALLLWNVLVGLTSPPKPKPGTAGTAVDTSVAEPLAPMAIPDGITLRGAEDEERFEIGAGTADAGGGETADAYPLSLELSNRGAALVSARLQHYAARLHSEERYLITAPLESAGRTHYSMVTEKVTIGDRDIPVGQAHWAGRRREVEGGQEVVFQLDVLENDAPLLTITKTYSLPRQADANGHSDVQVTLVLENPGTVPRKVKLTQWGPVGLPMEDPRQDLRRVTAALTDGQTMSTEFLRYGKLTAELQLLQDPQDPQDLVWAAVGNKFFAVIVAPREAEGGPWIDDARACSLAAQDDEADGATFRMAATRLALEPGGTLTRQLDCYFGPKSKPVFTDDEVYARRQYVMLINADYYMCAWTWVVNLMLGLLNVVHGVWPHNYGIAIIVMVLVVRTLLHPLTKQGQVSMVKMSEQMSKLQPKMEELRERHKNDKQKLNQETMKLYQQEGVNPASQMFTCLPMMFQLPIWAGLWTALMYTVELRHQPFFLWVDDLTAPDQFMSLGREIFFVGDSLNVLPLLLGLSMWLQNRYMPRPASTAGGKTSDQLAQQRMMMSIMSVMMIVFFYNAPSGLTLYIMASNFFGLLEQYFIRKHIREEKEKAKANPTTEPPKPRFQKPKWVRKLEKMAEQARKPDSRPRG